MITYTTKKSLKRVVFYFLVIVITTLFSFPLYWMLISSLKPTKEIFSHPARPIPLHATLENYFRGLSKTLFGRFFLNSLIVMFGVIVIAVFTATLAGYALSRLAFRGQRSLARMVLFSYMFPPIILATPMFILWKNLHIFNTYIGIILAQLALAFPFSLWMMWKSYQAIPISYEEAARVYGASRYRAFREITLPLAKPGMIAVAIYAFAVSWNDFTFAQVLLRTSEMKTLTVGMMTFIEQQSVYWGMMLAAGTVISIPPFLIVYFLQDQMLRGFTIKSGV